MKNNKIFVIAALLGTTLASCQKEMETQTPEEVQPVPVKTVTFTVKATKNAETRAMNLDGTTLTAFWKEGEKVAVYVAGQTEPQGTLTADEVTNEGGVSTATFTGEMSIANLADGSNTLTLLFPGRGDAKWTYEGQDGTAPSLDGTMATSFDYALATITATYNEAAGTLTPASDASFENQQSIFRFGFNMEMSSFTVTSAQNRLVVSRAFDGSDWTSTLGALVVNPGTPADKDYFISIRNENESVDDRLYFSHIAEGGALYEGSQKIKTKHLGNDKYLVANVTMAQKTLDPSASTITKEEDVL